MKKKKNFNGAIIVFFKNISTKQSDGYHLYLDAKFNRSYKLYSCSGYEKRIQDLACAILNKEIKDIHQLETVKGEIEKWMGSALYDDSFFSIKDPEKSLFENRKTENIEEFCELFLIDIINKLNTKTKERFLLFPVNHFSDIPFSFGNIVFLKRNKDNIQIIKECFTASDNDIELITQLFNETMDEPVFKKYDEFLLISTNENYSFLENSENIIKRFVTVSLSFCKYELSKISFAMSTPAICSIYHENDGDIATKNYQNFKNPILPNLLLEEKEFIFNKEFVSDWFLNFNQLKKEEKEKIDKSIYILNNAFCNKKGKKFNDICISVDALFGINRKVTKTVNGNLKNIIKKYDGSELFIEKITLLWKLRNEMVHGSEKEIKDSKTYLEYKLKYYVCPEEDYIDLAFFCIKHSTNYFKNNYFLDFKKNKKSIIEKIQLFLGKRKY